MTFYLCGKLNLRVFVKVLFWREGVGGGGASHWLGRRLILDLVRCLTVADIETRNTCLSFQCIPGNNFARQTTEWKSYLNFITIAFYIHTVSPLFRQLNFTV